jgi:hypothetical protein
MPLQVSADVERHESMLSSYDSVPYTGGHLFSGQLPAIGEAPG